MRKVVIDSLVSLDGFYTDGKSEIDWFEFEDEDMAWSHDALSNIGTLVFGRKTYEEFSGVFPKMEEKLPDGWDPFIPKSLNALPKVVFSKTLKEGSWKPVTIVGTDPASEIARLKEGTGKDIEIIGSGSVVSAAIRAGLVDEFRLRVQPILLGSGRPLYPDKADRLRLKLVKSLTFKSGVLGLQYEPRR
jgi:dihydrofolate reductase